MSYDPFEDLDYNMFHDPRSEYASHAFNQHIDTFIQIGKHVWDMILFTFDGDPTYDFEGNTQKNDWSLYIYDSDVWDGDGDMTKYFFHRFEDKLTQRFPDDFQPTYSDFYRHHVVACPKKYKVNATKRKYFDFLTLGRYL
jgi:hypothetical protein